MEAAAFMTSLVLAAADAGALSTRTTNEEVVLLSPFLGRNPSDELLEDDKLRGLAIGIEGKEFSETSALRLVAVGLLGAGGGKAAGAKLSRLLPERSEDWLRS